MKVSVSEAKATLSALVAQAQRGEVIVMTVRGKPVAILRSLLSKDELDAESKRYAETQIASARGLTLAELIKSQA